MSKFLGQLRRRARDLKRSSCSHSQKLYFIYSPYNSVEQKILVKISFPLSHASQIRKKNAIFLIKRYPLIASASISHFYKPPVHGTGAVTVTTLLFLVWNNPKCCSFRSSPLKGHIWVCSGECQECPSLGDVRKHQITPSAALSWAALPSGTARACVWNITAH